MNPPHGDLVLSEVSICASPNLDILGVKFDRRLTFEDHVRGIVSSVSQRTGILRLVKRVFVNISVLPTAKCHLQFLDRQVYTVARLFPEQTFLPLCYRRHVAALCMLYKVNSNSNHCLFSELPSASVRVRHTQAAAAAHTLEFDVSRCRTSQFARCFLPAQTRVCGMNFSALCLTPER